LLRADFVDSDSFFENEMQAKPEQSRLSDGDRLRIAGQAPQAH